MLLWLAALGFMSVGLSVVLAEHQASLWKTQRLEALQLNDERQRLIHYSADYATLYAPGGAGPGHLPCPDTDPNNTRPGPNPPCGRNKVAVGQLPDGVSRAVGRVAFSAALLNRVSYSVAKSIVNNPSRGISIGQWPDEHIFSQIHTGYAQLTHGSGQSRVVTKTELEALTLLWVRAWFVTQLLETKLSGCEKLPTHQSLLVSQIDVPFVLQADKQADVYYQARRRVRALALCQQPDLAPCSSEETTCALRDEQLIDWWVGPDASEWQGVPISRHWFITNGWYRSAALSWQRRCLKTSSSCLLVMETTPNGLQLDLIASDSLFVPTNPLTLP